MSLDDPYVALARDGVREISLALRQGEYLVDILPWRKTFNTHRLSFAAGLPISSEVRSQMVSGGSWVKSRRKVQDYLVMRAIFHLSKRGKRS